MANIPADVGKSILDKFIDCGIEESRYVRRFSDIVSDFEKEKKDLEEKRLTVNEYVNKAKRDRNNIRPDVTHWQRKAEELVQEDTQMKKTCFLGLCPNCKWRYSRGKELTSKTEEIKTLLLQSNEFINGSVGISTYLPGVEYHSSEDYVSFESRKLKIKELLDALKDDNHFIVGLQGMGGAGKTTLANEVGKELKELKQFDHVIDTTVSNTPDISKIQDDIAAPLRLDLKDKNESERPKLLWSRLTGGEKILLILDDVWDPCFKFDEIGIPNKDNHKGCRILLTTREMTVCKSMGCERIIQLDILSEEDAWTLFKKHANVSHGSSKRLLDKGRDITKKCKGLPVAIAAIASSLRGEESLETWKTTLRSLKSASDEELVDKCLRRSYDNLKEEGAKKLFRLCSMFPEDEELSDEILTRFCIGVRLFGELDKKYDDARDQVVAAKNKLVNSCLLIKAGKQSVKMHDLIREVALKIAVDEVEAVNWHKNQKPVFEKGKNIKYLSCQGKSMDVFSCKFDNPQLEILNVYLGKEGDEGDDVQIPTSFFENMTELRVLHLSIRGSWSPSLLQSLQSLTTNIRSLILHNNLNSSDFSFLKKLPNLETLDLFFGWNDVDELPCEIAKLEKLRVLYLRCGYVANLNSFEVIKRCSSLEELYIFGLYIWNDDISKLHDKITFPAFRRYIIRDGQYDDSLSKCVALSNIDAFFSEMTFKHLMQISELLHLQEIKGEWRNLVPDIVPMDKDMNDLVDLTLSESPQLQCLIDTTHDSVRRSFFSNLNRLKLETMENFEALCHGPFPFDFLNNLRWLIIRECINLRSILFKGKLNLCFLKTIELYGCPKLVSLFQLSTCQTLLLLDELSVSGCEQLKNIIAEGENDNRSCGSMFPNLKNLDIRKCPQLEYILPTLSTQVVPLLETIRANDCGELKYIFQQYKHEHASKDLHQEAKDIILGSLKNVEFCGLPNFIDIFPKCCCSICSSVTGSSYQNDSMEKTESKTNKCNISSWIHMCYPNKHRRNVKSTKSTNIPLAFNDPLQDSSISSGSNFDYLRPWQRAQCLWKQPQILRNIKEIELKKFSKIKSIFILSVAPMMLETLIIEDCDELKHVIVDIRDDLGDNILSYVFPNLKEISVKGCRQLEYIFGRWLDDHQNHNKIKLDLQVLETLCLDDLPSLIGICSKNYITTLPPLMKFELKGCSQISIKSFGDYILSFNNRSIKELNENVKHVLSLRNLCVHGSKFENIICFNEIIAQEINLVFEHILLEDLPHLSSLFIAPKNSFILQNLTELIIVQCEILEAIFTASISTCLPQLQRLIIMECKELKQIIEEGAENQEMSFPKLKVIMVEKCNKLTYLFPVSTSKQLPLLKALIIKEASELKEVFKCESDQKVEFPQLRLLIFVKLPIFRLKIELENTGLWVQSCPKLSLTSTIESHELMNIVYHYLFTGGAYYSWNIRGRIRQDLEITEDIEAELDVQAPSQSELASSEVNRNRSIAETKHELVEEVSTSKIPSATTSPMKRHEAHSDEHGDGQIAIPSVLVVSTEPPSVQETSEIVVALTNSHDRVSLNGDASMEVSSIVEELLLNNDGIGVSDSKPFPSIPSHVLSKSLSTPFEGSPSQTMDDVNFASLVKSELEQLVSNKYLASENMTLLTEFLAKHPSLRLKDNALSNKYRGYAYTCLAELLKFLQTHSVLDVLGSNHSNFMELMQDVRSFGFDKNWLDGVERRALFSTLQVTEDALQKLLDSKRILTQHVKDLKQQVASSEAVLESIIQEETQVLEARAALSAPLGY